MKETKKEKKFSDEVKRAQVLVEDLYMLFNFLLVGSGDILSMGEEDTISLIEEMEKIDKDFLSTLKKIKRFYNEL